MAWSAKTVESVMKDASVKTVFLQMNLVVHMSLPERKAWSVQKVLSAMVS